MGDGTTGNERLLALKMYSGNVIEAFKKKTVFFDQEAPVIDVARIDAGKSHQWPIFGNDIEPEYHTPGDFLGGKTTVMDESVVTVDEYLVGHQDVPFDDQHVSHFPVLSKFARKIGRGLAIDVDSKICRVGLNAARAAASTVDSLPVHSGGNRVTRTASTSGTFTFTDVYPASTTGSGYFRDDIRQLAQNMDEDNVPEENRYLFIPPVMRRVLSYETGIFDRDYNPEAVAGTMNMRAIGVVEGFQIIVSNNMPSTNINTGLSKYQGNFSTEQSGSEDYGLPAALALCGADDANGAAIGMTILDDMRHVVMPDERRNTTFLKSQMLIGLGIVAPWCAGEIAIVDVT